MVKSKRTRRGFSPEFKLEAVRRVLERTASGVSLAQLGRELDVRPDLLRAWVRQAQERSGATATDVFPGHGRLPSDQEELRRVAVGERATPAGAGFPKTGGGVLREGVAMSDKYAAIARERHRFPVALMCAALGVSPSGFYAAQQRPASARTCRVERLRLVTRAAFAAPAACTAC